MDQVTGKRLLELVEQCADLLNGMGRHLGGASENSLALYQLHSAAILGSALSYIVVPIYRENPELQRKSSGQALAVFRMPPDVIKATLGTLAGVKDAMQDARSAIEGAALTADERSSYLGGIEKVLGYVDETVDVISRQRDEEAKH